MDHAHLSLKGQFIAQPDLPINLLALLETVIFKKSNDQSEKIQRDSNSRQLCAKPSGLKKYISEDPFRRTSMS